MVIPKVVDHWQQLIKGLNTALHIAPKPLSEQVLGAMLNHVLKPELQQQKLRFLVNQWVQIEVPDLSLVFYVTAVANPHTMRLKVSVKPQLAAVTMRGNSASLVLLMSGQVDPDTLFFRRKLLIKGDTELGLSVKNLLDTIELEGRLPGTLYRATQETATLILAKPELR